MTLIADVFPNLRTAKNVVRSMYKNARFRREYENQDGKPAQTLLKLERQHLYHIYWSMWNQLTYKKSHLVIYKIFRLFVNTLTADDKFSLLNTDNSMQPIQMLLSQKQKILLNFSL